MATKAQTFRTQQQRDANPPKPKQPRRPRRDLVVDTAAPGVSATDRKSGPGNAGTTPSTRVEERGGAALETTDTGRPSRKSTRKSAARAKLGTAMQRKAKRATRSPKVRAAKAKARSTTTRGKPKVTTKAKAKATPKATKR